MAGFRKWWAIVDYTGKQVNLRTGVMTSDDRTHSEEEYVFDMGNEAAARTMWLCFNDLQFTSCPFVLKE